MFSRRRNYPAKYWRRESDTMVTSCLSTRDEVYSPVQIARLGKMPRVFPSYGFPGGILPDAGRPIDEERHFGRNFMD